MKKLLLIILLGMAWITTPAQSFFNRRYTLHSLSTIFTSIIPRDGKYYCTGLIWDSSNYTGSNYEWYDVQGINFTIFDSLGNVISDSTYQEPFTRNLYTWNNSLYSMPDKSFVLAVTNDIDTANYHMLIVHYDSIGRVLNTKEFDKTFCPNIHFWNVNDMKPTGTGEWLVLSTNGCANQDNMLLTKMDSNFNIEWQKQYINPNVNHGGQRILVESDGYLLAGARDNANLTFNYTTFAQLIKVDSSGNQLWNWTRPGPKYTYDIKDIIRTSDGGYIYCTFGNGYINEEELYCKGWIEKLDSNRNIMWNDTFSAIASNTIYNSLNVLKQLPDSNLIVAGMITGGWDVNDTGDVNFGAMIKLNQQGQVIWKRKYSIPDDTLETIIFDMKFTSDGGFILSGQSSRLIDASNSPTTRGLLIKVDSNGCLGPDDPQCQPEGVTHVPEALSRLNIYPNPAHSTFTVSYKLVNNEDALLEIMDIAGKQVQSIRLNGTQNYTVVNCAAWASGVYIYRVVQEGKVINTGKLARY